MLLDHFFFLFYRIQKRDTDKQLVNCEEWKKKKMSIHKAPDLGIRKRVFIQYVPDSGAPSRDQQKRQPHRQTSENLVSKPQDET